MWREVVLGASSRRFHFQQRNSRVPGVQHYTSNRLCRCNHIARNTCRNALVSKLRESAIVSDFGGNGSLNRSETLEQRVTVFRVATASRTNADQTKRLCGLYCNRSVCLYPISWPQSLGTNGEHPFLSRRDRRSHASPDTTRARTCGATPAYASKKCNRHSSPPFRSTESLDPTPSGLQ